MRRYIFKKCKTEDEKITPRHIMELSRSKDMGIDYSAKKIDKFTMSGDSFMSGLFYSLAMEQWHQTAAWQGGAINR
jgi:hypothetical protein